MTLPTGTVAWLAYGGGYQSPEYRKIGDVVCLRGIANRTTPSSTVSNSDTSVQRTVANLPSGYRPSAKVGYATRGYDQEDAVDKIDIQTNGDIIVVRTSGTHNFIFLDGICFSTL